METDTDGRTDWLRSVCGFCLLSASFASYPCSLTFSHRPPTRTATRPLLIAFRGDVAAELVGDSATSVPKRREAVLARKEVTRSVKAANPNVFFLLPKKVKLGVAATSCWDTLSPTGMTTASRSNRTGSMGVLST
ncbi:unnamed protein product [Protopolystoma xenopodis]|uniref:Uncharacterized protein n=1 Tax=Protopolystoma xenopodis TaxID=117903 RepID=A0A3S5B5B3_9PLAT|nr:unnamed protein product [Protopolystoma xenopodis]